MQIPIAEAGRYGNAGTVVHSGIQDLGHLLEGAF